MTQHLYPALYALLIWWFSTGVLLYLIGRPARTFSWSLPIGTGIFAMALAGLWASAADTTLAGAYCAFTCGLVAWGWQEMSFYMGAVTGPRKIACPADCPVWRRFGYGVGTCLWHELAVIATAIAIVALTWGLPNQIGVLTFLILWGMRLSAKLNVFLGVRNLSEQFLPEHMVYLKSYFRRRTMNPLFPVSVTLATVLAGVLVIQAGGAETAAAAAGWTMLATLVVLGVLEHWFLVLPVAVDALWAWAMGRRRRSARPLDAPIIGEPRPARVKDERRLVTVMQARIDPAAP